MSGASWPSKTMCFRVSATLWPSKGSVFSSLRPWTFKKWCLTLSGTTGTSNISCCIESDTQGHSENDYLICLLLVLGVRPSKRRPIESTITLDQPPDKLKSARKKQQKRITSIGSPTAAVWAQPTRIKAHRIPPSTPLDLVHVAAADSLPPRR